MRDLKNNTSVSQSLAPASRSASANGTGVDLLGQKKDAVLVVFHPGAIASGTWTPSVEESDDDSAYTAVAAADLEGTLAALVANTVQAVGYKGGKRYVRAVLTTASSPASSLVSAEVVTVPLVRPA